MATFYDALSGEKRKLNYRTKKTPTPEPPVVLGNCFFHHDFLDPEDDLCKCRRCGVSVVRARAAENIKSKGL